MTTLTGITPAGNVFVDRFGLTFSAPNGHGYTFTCDEDGQILSIGRYARLSLTTAISAYLDGTMTMEIADESYNYHEPATGTCACGQVVELIDPLRNHCGCGQDYNLLGQPVLPPCVTSHGTTNLARPVPTLATGAGVYV